MTNRISLVHSEKYVMWYYTPIGFAISDFPIQIGVAQVRSRSYQKIEKLNVFLFIRASLKFK